MGNRVANGLVVVFFIGVIGIVFQQIATSMHDQGIASGGPYDNAAAYPQAIAIIVALLLGLHLVQEFFSGRDRDRKSEDTSVSAKDRASASSIPSDSPAQPAQPGMGALVRPALLLVIFACYLALLNPLGYHLTTAPMLLLVMWLCGVRQLTTLIGASLGIAFVLAFLFEHFLKIVLPGGLFALNLPW